MNLTESQLFTIEALNRIDGFVWPDDHECAAMDEGAEKVYFYSSFPLRLHHHFEPEQSEYYHGKHVGAEHPDWRNSLITREQFDSVDGWVRDSGYPKKMNITVIELSDGSYKWRYHKPTKEAEAQQPEPKQPTLLEILARDLPKRGGWPEGANLAMRHYDELSPLKPSVLFGDGDSVGNFGLISVMAIDSVRLASDHKGKIITKAAYLAEVARVAVSKDLNKWNNEVMDMANKLSIGDIKERVSACFRGDCSESYKPESIDSLYSRYELAKQNTKAGREELARLEEEEYKLFGEIERWNEERGFSVIDISDREEKKELVITDWRDLRVGDVVSWDVNDSVGECVIIGVYQDSKAGEPCVAIRTGDGGEYNAYENEIKFIRRP
ncbi:MAG: hypothetical protein ACRDC5_06740 [Vibrio sp.]